MNCSQASLSMEFSKTDNTGGGCHFLLQGIWMSQGQPTPPALQVDSYRLSHQGSPHILGICLNIQVRSCQTSSHQGTDRRAWCWQRGERWRRRLVRGEGSVYLQLAGALCANSPSGSSRVYPGHWWQQNYHETVRDTAPPRPDESKSVF